MDLEAEITQEKTRLDEFLQRKEIDQSWLLGFFQQLHPKFIKWILADFKNYYTNIYVLKLPCNFSTIKLIDRLWLQFHYPIIKYYQYSHASILHETDESFKTLKGQNNLAHFKVKPVEIRKINASFLKFFRLTKTFYTNLMSEFVVSYKNSLLPTKIFEFFQLKLSEDPTDTSNNTTVQANLLYCVHRTLLALGDISRHRSFFDLNYVEPCISNKAYFKLKNLSGKDKITTLLPNYSKALQYYQFCIMLLPALNEPYNHIGVIYNHIDDKFNAILWFLRSQFTRLPDYKLGMANLLTIMNKRWFLNNLFEFEKKNFNHFSAGDITNIYLLCLCGFYYTPDTYRRGGGNITRDTSVAKLESMLLQSLADNFDKIVDTNLILDQLTVLFSFGKLLENAKSKENSKSVDSYTRFNKLTFRYIDKFFELCVDSKKTHSQALIITRFILNWLKENKSIYRLLQYKQGSTMKLIMKYLNFFMQSCPGLNFNLRPRRNYYFAEDVNFKDCLLINYQFKDFKDDGLFEIDNIDLLVGDYSSLMKDGVPTFCSASQESTAEDVNSYENNLRIEAIVVLGKKLLAKNSFDIHFDEEDNLFVVDKERKSQTNKEKSQANDKEKTHTNEKVVQKVKQPERNKENVPIEKDDKVKVKIAKRKKEAEPIAAEPVTVAPIAHKDIEVPFSIEDIQKSISTHTSKLQEKLKISEPSDRESSPEDDRLENMVDSIVTETGKGTSSEGNTNSNSNIWGVNNQQQQAQQPFKIPNLEAANATAPASQPPTQNFYGNTQTSQSPAIQQPQQFYLPYPQYSQQFQQFNRDGVVSPYPTFIPQQYPTNFAPFDQQVPQYQPPLHNYPQAYYPQQPYPDQQKTQFNQFYPNRVIPNQDQSQNSQNFKQPETNPYPQYQ